MFVFFRATSARNLNVRTTEKAQTTEAKKIAVFARVIYIRSLIYDFCMLMKWP